MNIILFDDPVLRQQLLPFTYTRPIADIRVGILTMAEKWRILTVHKVSYLTDGYLATKFGVHFTDDNYFINGALCPTEDFIVTVLNLKEEQAIVQNGQLLAVRTSKALSYDSWLEKKWTDFTEYSKPLHLIDRPWKIFQLNGEEIRRDYELVTNGRVSGDVTDPFTRVYNPDDVFIEEGASVLCAIINAENGPVYIGKNAQIMEGAIIRGPFAMGESSVISMGAKIRPDTTLGPYCKVGGEVSNAVFFGNSNKGHEGYVGNAVVGEWCNLGADTNASNLKNNYANVKVWNFSEEAFIDSGLQFCGLMMGDHSKCGINTMFNTGTVVGVCANVFGGGFPPSFVPSFSWGGAESLTTYRPEPALETIGKVYERRKKALDQTERKILMEVYKRSAKFRTWEKQ